jgi:hypothetical protein
MEENPYQTPPATIEDSPPKGPPSRRNLYGYLLFAVLGIMAGGILSESLGLWTLSGLCMSLGGILGVATYRFLA